MSQGGSQQGKESRLSEIVKRDEQKILAGWMEKHTASTKTRKDLMSDQALATQSKQFLKLFTESLEKGSIQNIDNTSWNAAKDFLKDLSASRAQQGFTPSETANFVFSLKEPIFDALRAEAKEVSIFAEMAWGLIAVLDSLGLYTAEIFIRNREDIIRRQQQDMLELSTPVVRLWEGVLALPLIGTLDSARTQVVMETLLQEIVETGASIAIIDITGVPTVDTLVAQHLLKTVAAARLMGADCIISGIRPQIAQTIVHLGVELNDVITKATLADAFMIALSRLKFSIIGGEKMGSGN